MYISHSSINTHVHSHKHRLDVDWAAAVVVHDGIPSRTSGDKHVDEYYDVDVYNNDQFALRVLACSCRGDESAVYAQRAQRSSLSF